MIETELSIEKALQFAGDNSDYQKKRLLILSVIILSLAILTCKMPLEGPKMTMIFLFASGAGQVVCPIYLSMRTIAIFLSGFAILASAFYPISQSLTDVSYCGIGFFGRGFFVSSLIYLNEIGGDRFRAWSMIVVFAIWGISSLFSSIQKIFNLSRWFCYYFLIFIPMITDTYFVLSYWKPSPFHLYTKRLFTEAKEVLNNMAQENNRPYLPYGLENEHETDDIAFLGYKKPTYFDIVNRPVIRRITIPLLVVWVYREYIYYGSYIIIPQLGLDYSKNLILLSISETVAVLMSYPIRLYIKRVNAFLGFAIVIAICSFISSFTTMSLECMKKGSVCPTKYIYLVSIMLIRFSIALTGNILISYTLQVYPSNARSLGFSLCLGVSSIGSTLMPWINQTFIYANLSGFISFTVASLIAIYFITKLNETFGRMRTENLEELEQSAQIISLKNWATLNF